jgi:S-adenosylmethionine:diacylglycerol 3-amino-3-carboxypropyl transferase
MIWYSHVNEDSSPEIIYSKGHSSIIAVIGSGERLIALLNNTDLKDVFAVDTNADAIELLKLKLVALTELDVEHYLKFIGAKKMSSNERMNCFIQFRDKLETSSKRFWDNHHHFIKMGILHIGQYEQFLSKVRPILKWFLGASFLNIFNIDYDGFSKFKWKIVKSLFSKKISYKLFGNKDPAFVGKGVDLSIITNGFQELIDKKEFHKSFMAYLVFLGSLKQMSLEFLPASLNLETLKKIQDKLRNKAFKIQFINNGVLNFLEEKNFKTFNSNIFLSMSDILSFHNTDYAIKCIEAMHTDKEYNRRFVVRSYLRNHLDDHAISKIKALGYKVENISNLDSTKMYKVHLVEKL